MTEIEYRRIEPVTVYAASGIAAGGPEGVPTVIDQILPPLLGALHSSGVEHREPGIFWYEPVDGTDDLRVWVSWIAGDEPVESPDWQVVELPAVERAATTRYEGDMPGIGRAWSEFMQAIAADGVEMYGACREVYLEAPSDRPQSEWVTELQQPVR
ncbi:GyrI-like domain-containing protein [Microbacterium sp. BWT-B31]|uniref:GyrI-like domain-containing protein n=1 Tax=Microbacterium sp. BWT-B31 TaxID=3232072 RepID=UPI003528E839